MFYKTIVILIFMYSTSFSLLGAQYVIGDVLGIQIRDVNGNPILGPLQDLTDAPALNQMAEGISSINQTTIVDNPITGAANLTWVFIQLATGVYIFNIITLFGIPAIFVNAFIAIYTILIVITFIQLVRPGIAGGP